MRSVDNAGRSPVVVRLLALLLLAVIAKDGTVRGQTRESAAVRSAQRKTQVAPPGQLPPGVVQSECTLNVLQAKGTSDSTRIALEKKVAATQEDVGKFADSLVLALRDSVSKIRQDSLTLRAQGLATGLQSYLAGAHLHLDALHKEHTHRIDQLPSLPFEDVTRLRDTLAELHSQYRDTLSSVLDEFTSVLDDTTTSIREDLTEFAADLIDRQSDDNDAAQARLDSLAEEEERASHFTLEADYAGRVTYRGTDGGVTQHAYTPRVTYMHRSGFSLTAAAYYLTGGQPGWDEADLGVSYEHNFTDELGCSISYTHNFFSLTSRQVKSSLLNELDGGISFDASWLNLSANVGLAFGKGKDDIYVAGGASRHVDLLAKPHPVNIWLEPQASVTLGTLSNLKTTSQSLQATTPSTTTATSKQKNVFTVVAYEFVLPVTFQYESFQCTPALNYAIPVNQPAELQTSAFAYFTLNVSMTIR